MRFEHLDDWLNWQETLNPAEIELGLNRVSAVLTTAGLSSTFDCPLITVAGTNGKGSVVAMLEAIAIAAGLNVCSYTSPHIFRYNERIKVNGHAVDDDSICQAFDHIDQVRAEHPLTYFEFGTLAAIELFFRQQPDLVILEVGLGGRLDAVNIMDADVSVLTSIAIDHVDWLGDDRESIGFEKAGIFRPGQTVICGEYEPTESVLKRAEQLHCELYRAGQQFQVVAATDSNDTDAGNWTLKSNMGDILDLPSPALVGEFQKTNAASAILALQALTQNGSLLRRAASGAESGHRLTEDELGHASRKGLKTVSLVGRFQKINHRPQVYVDVAHNPHAAKALASQLQSSQAGADGKTWAIIAMLSDKDVAGVLDAVADRIDHWCFAGLEGVARGMSAATIISRLPASMALLAGEPGAQLEHEFCQNQCTILSQKAMMTKTVTEACEIVLSKADKDDRIIIFGSFYTVTEAMQFFT